MPQPPDQSPLQTVLYLLTRLLPRNLYWQLSRKFYVGFQMVMEILSTSWWPNILIEFMHDWVTFQKVICNIVMTLAVGTAYHKTGVHETGSHDCGWHDHCCLGTSFHHQGCHKTGCHERCCHDYVWNLTCVSSNLRAAICSFYWLVACCSCVRIVCLADSSLANPATGWDARQRLPIGNWI